MYCCYLCRDQINAGGFCQICCRDHFLPSDFTANNGKLRSLYTYSGVMRDLIIQAKVKNNHIALASLAKLFCINPEVLAAVSKADFVTPAPSSLWGRVRGRFDLAESLALSLERETGKLCQPLPIWSYLRWHKRAAHNEREADFNEDMHKPSLVFKDRKVLLVDDILTTGKSINSLKRILFRLGAAEVGAILLSSVPGVSTLSED